MYRERPRDAAVVHLHSTHSVAVSLLAGVDPKTCCRRSPPTTRCASASCRCCPTSRRATPGWPRRSAASPRAITRCCCEPRAGGGGRDARRGGRHRRGAGGHREALAHAPARAPAAPDRGAGGRPRAALPALRRRARPARPARRHRHDGDGRAVRGVGLPERRDQARRTGRSAGDAGRHTVRRRGAAAAALGLGPPHSAVAAGSNLVAGIVAGLAFGAESR